jgi:hypothetical protein
VASVFDALMQSDDSQSLKATGDKIQAAGRNLAAADETKADNSDMEQFSVFNWYEAGFERGAPDEEGCYWLEVLNFRASCCPSKVD